MKKLILSLSLILAVPLTEAKVAFFHNSGASEIKKTIASLQPKLSSKELGLISNSIARNSKKYNIDPEVFIKILMQESSFDQSQVSISGDISIAQINYDIWSKEFKRRNLLKLDKNQLKANVAYSIDVMSVILNSLKTKYSSREISWYTRYHSSNMKRRALYGSLLSRHSIY